MFKERKWKIMKPKDCEKILNYNGYYMTAQAGSYITFSDNNENAITIRRGEVALSIWKRLCIKYNLELPSKAYK